MKTEGQSAPEALGFPIEGKLLANNQLVDGEIRRMAGGALEHLARHRFCESATSDTETTGRIAGGRHGPALLYF